MQVLETFTYIGRNRRSDQCVIEHLIELAADELEALSKDAGDHSRQLRSVLQASGISLHTELFSDNPQTGDGAGLFAALYTESVLAIQRAAGHRVNFALTVNDPDPKRKRVVFEYEHADVGHRADQLALGLLVSIIPALKGNANCPEQTGSFSEMFNEFKEFAHPHILPPDTQAIIDAAARMDIPCVKLEREPYEGLSGDFRIRRNGLLKLGHSVYQHIVDGTFCVDKGAHLLPLLNDRERLFQVLTGLQIPVARQDHEFRNCINAGRAARSATAIGYPVVVKPSLRGRGQGIYQGISLGIPDAQALQLAVDKAQQCSRAVMVEKHIAGETYKVLVANDAVIAVVWVKNGTDVHTETHPSTLRMVVNLADQLGAGMLVADIVTAEIGSPLQHYHGAIVDLDLAPELDRFLTAGGDLHQRAMSAFVQWLYPPAAESRIPTVAITGTNGKTTTSRMITNIMQGGNFHTGFACTDGVYINDKLTEAGDLSGSGGHHRVFESREVNLGVLETARGALAHSGFMFDWCNVSVCLNVSADHLGQYGIETVEQMAELKRSVLESARDAVVLNADDEHCLGMLPFLSAPRVCLVSMSSGVEKLAEIPGHTACFSILEQINGSDWLVIHDDEQRMPVIEAVRVPASYGGLARFNICNALHAIAACYLLGMDVETLNQGIGSFHMSFENTPGRLNFYEEHPFRVLMDYAHNEDGMRKLCKFVEQVNISGSKYLMFQVRGDIEDTYIQRFAAVTAHHFDHYVCRTHPVYTGPDKQKVLGLIRGALLDSGVKEHQITMTTEPGFAVETMLQMGKKGDLLVFAPGSGQRLETWNQITSFDSG